MSDIADGFELERKKDRLRLRAKKDCKTSSFHSFSDSISYSSPIEVHYQPVNSVVKPASILLESDKRC